MLIVRSIFVVRTQHISCDIRKFVCRRENWRIFQLFYNNRRKLCFVVNVLNNKTIILLNLVEYRMILSNPAYGLVCYVSDDIPRDFAG